MKESDRFIDAVAANLVAPDRVRGEILEELAAHIGDTVAQLRDEGRTGEAATAEAVARLGPPDVLAKALTGAHRRPSHLLAAAGAGSWAAVRSGAVWTVAAWLVIGLLAFAGALLLRALVGWFGEPSIPGGWSGGSNTVVTAAGLAIGGFFAAASAVRAVAARGWWTSTQARVAVGVGGAGVVAIVALGILEQPLNWASVVAMLLVPLATALGAGLATVPLPARPAALAFLLAFALPAVFLSVATTWGGGAANYDWDESTHGYEMIAPWWQDPAAGPSTDFTSGESWSTTTGVEEVTVFAASPEIASQFHAFRLEAWRAEPPGNGWRLLPGQTTPFATAPMTVAASAVTGTLRFNRMPGVDWAQVVVTATGPDGRRYLVTSSSPKATVFYGSVIDWFVALGG